MKDMVCKVSNNDTPRSVIDGCMRKQLLTNIDSLTIALNSAIGTLYLQQHTLQRQWLFTNMTITGILLL